MRCIDTFGLCEAHHQRIADCYKCLDLIAWGNLRMGWANGPGGGGIIFLSSKSRRSQRFLGVTMVFQVAGPKRLIHAGILTSNLWASLQD
jgi:hypothetical protein